MLIVKKRVCTSLLTIGVREGEVRKLIEERRFITPSRGEFNAMTANAFASLIALRRAVEEFGVAHAVSFHTSIRRAAEFQQLSQEFNQAFPEQPAVCSFHIADTMRSTERDSILRNFAARPPSLVTNARCLTEGVDVPGINCVMFVDPKASTVDIVQAAGRAMRRAEGKTKAYIVLPFVVREGASIDDAAKTADFGFVVAVLGGDLTTTLTVPLAIRAGSVMLGANAQQLTLKLDAKKAGFSGSFVPPGATKAVKFGGALRAGAPGGGRGVFHGTTESGSVRIGVLP